MHEFFENVRTDIEGLAGQESYLTSALFYRMHKEIKYEDEGEYALRTKEEYETLQNRALNSISMKADFQTKEEVLSWQVAILRDISRDYYSKWEQYLSEEFLAGDCFNDGVACTKMEASCEKLGENPTETYTALLEVKHILTRLCTSSTKILMETEKLWEFKYRTDPQGEENIFLEKRRKNETEHTLLYQCIDRLQQVSDRCKDNGSYLAGSGHILWMQPYVQLESLIASLNGFLYCEYHEEPELVLNTWIDSIFPENLASGDPNLNRHGPLHLAILSKLAQASQCLARFVLRKEDTFARRDEVMRPFFRESFERARMEGMKKLIPIHSREQARV